MSYREVLTLLGPPERLDFSLGLTGLVFPNREEVWFKDGRVRYLLGHHRKIVDAPILHHHFDGDNCNDYSTPFFPYGEVTVAQGPPRDRLRDPIYVLGERAGETLESIDGPKVMIDAGFLRGVQGATSVGFSAGVVCTPCTHRRFRLGGGGTVNAPRNGTYSPMPHVSLEMKEGRIAEIHLYIEDEALFEALRELPVPWFL